MSYMLSSPDVHMNWLLTSVKLNFLDLPKPLQGAMEALKIHLV